MITLVYGTLKWAYRGQKFFDQPGYRLGTGHTVQKFLLYGGGHYPMAVFSNKHENAGHIHGEIYRATDDVLKELDHYEGHPYLFRRHRVAVRAGVTSLMAWVYFGQDAMSSIPTRPIIKPNADGLLIWPNEGEEQSVDSVV